MTLFSMIAFAIAMFLLAITPGPGVFATVSRGLVSGFSNASFVVLGIVLGDIIFLLLAIFGLGVIAEYLGDLFIFVKYIGGLYLVYLAYKILTSKDHENDMEAVKELSWQKNFLTGLIITLANPKVILFYLGFLPTFMELQALTMVDIAIICSIVIVVLGGVMLFYAYTASGAKMIFKSKKAKKKMKVASAGVMATAGTSIVIRA